MLERRSETSAAFSPSKSRSAMWVSRHVLFNVTHFQTWTLLQLPRNPRPN